MIKGYVVRGKYKGAGVFAVGANGFSEDGLGTSDEPQVFRTPRGALSSVVEMEDEFGCEDVTIFAVTEEGETPLLSYEAALARVDVLQKRERRIFDGFRADIDRIQEALGIGPTRSVLWCVAEIGRLMADRAALEQLRAAGRSKCDALDRAAGVDPESERRLAEHLAATAEPVVKAAPPVRAERSRLTMILAVAKNGVIGHDGGIPWRIPEDLKRFREMTMGHTLIVGRKTWETLPPLDGRRIVVVSRDEHRGALSLWDALVAARETDPEPIVIGGAEVYRDALPFVTRIHLTEIGADYEGDTVFHLDRTGFVETSRRAGETPGVSFVTLERC